MTYTKYILPNIEKVKFYAIVFLIFVGIVLFGYLVYIVRKRIENKKIEAERIANIPKTILDLQNKIQAHKPLKPREGTNNIEQFYQNGLYQYLFDNYPSLEIEKSINKSRPDIVFEQIAIEIKGPTTISGLKTIPDKINHYLPKRNYLFVVLFDLQINKKDYEDKKQEILENTIEAKREKIFFIEID